MNSEFAQAAKVLENSGLKKQADFCQKLATGKLTVYVILEAQADYGYLQWTSSPSPQDYCRVAKYPDVYLDIKTAKAVAVGATIKYARSTKLSEYWEGLCHHATEHMGFESVETITSTISEIYGEPFTPKDEFLARPEISDERLAEVIKKVGYDKYRAKPIKMSL